MNVNVFFIKVNNLKLKPIVKKDNMHMKIVFENYLTNFVLFIDVSIPKLWTN